MTIVFYLVPPHSCAVLYMMIAAYGTVLYRYPQSTSDYSISAVTCYSYYSELRLCTFYNNDATCSYDSDVAISCSNNGK